MLLLTATQQQQLPLAELIIAVTICGLIVSVVSWKNEQRWQNGRMEAVGIVFLASYTELESLHVTADSLFVGSLNLSTPLGGNLLVAVKLFLLFATACLFLVGTSYLTSTGLPQNTNNSPTQANVSNKTGGTMLNVEYYILTLLSLVGTLYLLSTDDTLSIYLSVELQTLAFYVLASFLRNSEVSTEAGFKYFVLGSLSSGLLLFGLSLLYFLTGLTTLSDMSELFYSSMVSQSSSILSDSSHSLSVALAVTFVLAALFFKIGLAPFHLWIPDVYEGAPTSVTALFAIIPKLPLVLLLLKVLLCFSAGDYTDATNMTSDSYEHHGNEIFSLLQPILLVTCILSIALGSFGAIVQQRMKRLLAFSTIAHMGFLLIPLTNAISLNATTSLYFYIFIYLLMSLALFAIILSLNLNNSFVLPTEGTHNIGVRRERPLTYVLDLKNLVFKNKLLAISISIIIFSMAGVPPLPGFYSKFYVLVYAFATDSFYLTVFALLVSIVSAGYYLYIVHSMFFVLVPESSMKNSKGYSRSTATVLAPISKVNATIIASLISSILFLSVLSPGVAIDTCQLWALTTMLSL